MKPSCSEPSSNNDFLGKSKFCKDTDDEDCSTAITSYPSLLFSSKNDNSLSCLTSIIFKCFSK